MQKPSFACSQFFWVRNIFNEVIFLPEQLMCSREDETKNNSQIFSSSICSWFEYMNFFLPTGLSTVARKLEPEKIITWKSLTGALQKTVWKLKTVWLIYCSWWDWKKAVLGKALFGAIMKHSFYGHRPFRVAFTFKMLANSQDNKDIICKKFRL